MLPRVRREVATIDLDSSIHEVYGEKKEGADFAYNNTWSYSVLYGTLAETGDLLYMDLREGYRHTSYGSQDVLPGMIKRVGEHFRAVRMRADELGGGRSGRRRKRRENLHKWFPARRRSGSAPHRTALM